MTIMLVISLMPFMQAPIICPQPATRITRHMATRTARVSMQAIITSPVASTAAIKQPSGTRKHATCLKLPVPLSAAGASSLPLFSARLSGPYSSPVACARW